MSDTYSIRQTTPEDASTLRALRLRALANSPTAFGSDLSEDEAKPESVWAERCAPTPRSAIFVATDDAGALVGMTGIVTDGRVKTGHLANIWGVFVAPEARGNRVGVRLIEAALDWARARGLRRASLSVEARNAPAISTYLKAGFTVYGVDREVLLIDGKFYDELLMAVWL
jgi:RimJ/RimL family protein N-acetyltransferase